MKAGVATAMVDFKKHIANASSSAPTEPLALYDTLDRASDKGPLRDAQAAVLREWHSNRRDQKDVIVKLHTGQGKTLIGLLMLQCKLNESKGPAVYLCPNNFLVAQSAAQAKQFGLKAVLADRDLPSEFLDCKAILVTSVQKFFNGRTKFGLGLQSLDVEAVVMDDSHACIDAIKEACMIRVAKDAQAYSDLLNLFSEELERQGVGTYADLRNGRREAILPVPYWDWMDKQTEIAAILSKYSTNDAIRFPWPLLKDGLADCQCVISGSGLEIAPYLAPLHLFGSFANARHRVFMSATVTNDSFLVKGLGLTQDVIKNPLIYKNETWSGERMILIPSLINDSLSREFLVMNFARPVPKRTTGVVVLVPNSYGYQDWGKYGAVVADTNTIGSEVGKLLNGDCEHTLVVVNRYDGIDLPDDACRILVLDSKPRSQNLIDLYMETCRASSDAIATRTARIIEQGLGRSVRGERDYCVFIILGASLVKALRTTKERTFFSAQTRMQIEIGLEIAEYAKDEISSGTEPQKALSVLINQCLKRDSAWKEYYSERMKNTESSREEPRMLDVFTAELNAESKYQAGDCDGATARIQKLIDEHVKDDRHDRGWYLQEMARYTYTKGKTQSNELQVSAHSHNRFLLRPKHGMKVQRVELIAQKRVENILKWIRSFTTFEDLQLALDEILTDFQFGISADDFEESVNKLAGVLGFTGERPDKEWKEGPDNLWALRDNEYLLIECKSEVDLKRTEINKTESGQMNNAIAWFKKYYGAAKATNLMIIPTKYVGHAAGFNEPVHVMRNANLKNFSHTVESFYRELKSYDLKSISEAKISELLSAHHLSIDEILRAYFENPKNL
jgi:replicative superfamily II helicase